MGLSWGRRRRGVTIPAGGVLIGMRDRSQFADGQTKPRKYAIETLNLEGQEGFRGVFTFFMYINVGTDFARV